MPTLSVTPTPDTIVVVGASVAGVAAVQALRTNGFGGRLVLCDGAREHPHDKPALSKEFLTGSLDEDDIALLTDELVSELNRDLALGGPTALL